MVGCCENALGAGSDRALVGCDGGGGVVLVGASIAAAAGNGERGTSARGSKWQSVATASTGRATSSRDERGFRVSLSRGRVTDEGYERPTSCTERTVRRRGEWSREKSSRTSLPLSLSFTRSCGCDHYSPRIVDRSRPSESSHRVETVQLRSLSRSASSNSLRLRSPTPTPNDLGPVGSTSSRRGVTRASSSTSTPHRRRRRSSYRP